MPSSPRPNILWFCTDQQRFDTIGALGNPHVQTPRIDEFLGRSATFTHAYCQSPICTPSRASFMTGMYPSRIHNCRNGNGTWPEHPPLVSNLLADSGYVCGLVGKFHLQSSGHRTEPRLDDGYSFWKFSHAPRDDWEHGHDYADWVRERGGDLKSLQNQPDNIPTEFHQTTWAAERSIEFIRSNRNPDSVSAAPWMLSVNVYDPHPPYCPPKEYADKFDPEAMPAPHFQPSDIEAQRLLSEADFQDEIRTPEEHDAKRKLADYYAMIAQIDDRFGEILDALEASGQAENTLVIFTSDHGDALGDHGLMYKGCRFYEGLVRVPLILRWPGKFTPGLRSDALVELIDLTATILDAAGIDPPESMQGRSLAPIATGTEDPSHFRSSVRSEYFEALDPHFTGGSGTYATMFREKRYKLCIYHSISAGELFDLQEDPWEHHNIWDDPTHRAIRDDLIFQSFNHHVLASTDVGSPRIAPM